MKEKNLENVIQIRLSSLIELLALPLATQFGDCDSIDHSEITKHLDNIFNSNVSNPHIFGFAVDGLENSEIDWARDYIESYYFSRKKHD